MFNDNFAMQSMMVHTTIMQQNENMRSLQRMMENSQHQFQSSQHRQMQEMEILREIYEEEDIIKRQILRT